MSLKCGFCYVLDDRERLTEDELVGCVLKCSQPFHRDLHSPCGCECQIEP